MLVPKSLFIEKHVVVAMMALLSATLVPSAAALEIHVSPNGSDQKPGTRAAPVKSLEAARKLARAKAGRERVTITVHDGVYYFDQPLVLQSEDSGAPGYPVIYRAAHEGKAVLSGGMPLTLQWTPYQNGVFQAKTPPGLELDQLFVDGVRQVIINGQLQTGTATQDIAWMGARLRPVTGSEMSAYGVSFDTKGLAIDDIDNNSWLGEAQGLQKGDLILELNRKPMTGIKELRKALQTVNDGKLQLRVIRNQKETTVNLELNDLVKP